MHLSANTLDQSDPDPSVLAGTSVKAQRKSQTPRKGVPKWMTFYR
jgi:hypothetical protein